MGTAATVAATGTATLTVTQLVPIVDWALTGFIGPAPANLSTIIAVGVIAAAHAGYLVLKGRLAKIAPDVAQGLETPAEGAAQ